MWICDFDFTFLFRQQTFSTDHWSVNVSHPTITANSVPWWTLVLLHVNGFNTRLEDLNLFFFKKREIFYCHYFFLYFSKQTKNTTCQKLWNPLRTQCIWVITVKICSKLQQQEMCFLLTWQSLIEIQSYQNNDRLQLFQLLSSLRSITTTSVSCPPLSICDKDLQDTQHYCYHYLMQVYFYTSKWLMVVLSYTKKKHYFITNRYFYLTVLYYSVNIHILPWALFFHL